MPEQDSNSSATEGTRRPSWHVYSEADMLRRLDASDSGLTGAQAAERLERFGRNRLPEKKPATFLQIFAWQFVNPLIYILVVAASLAALTGEVTDALFILAVLLINALLGSYHETRAEKSSQALQKLLKIRATVYRDGEAAEIDAEELVPGDQVWLESGNAHLGSRKRARS